MEIFVLSEDIPVMYVTATSFPDGINDAHTLLRSMFPSKRRYFGLSRPENGVIQYKAAAESEPDEWKPLNLQTMVIKQGTYAAIIIDKYTENLPAIGEAFEEILELTNIDPQGYCVECYLDHQQVRCMVRLAP